MIYSYSRLSQYENCPYAWYLRYIEGEEGESNYWAENGLIVHKILEQIANREVSLEEAPFLYSDYYDLGIDHPVKDTTMDKCFSDCLNFFAEYGFEYLDEYEVVGTEVHLTFDVGGTKFQCYIDALLRNKNGDYIVLDYKSCAGFFSVKTGKLLKKLEDTFKEYKKQATLYAIAVFQNYGAYPVKLAWLHFRTGEWSEIELSDADIKEVEKWVKDTIININSDQEFQPKKDWFMCNNLCEYRDTCEYKLYEEDDDE